MKTSRKRAPSYVRCVTWSEANHHAQIDSFLNRPAVDREAEATARKVLDDIRVRGDTAVMKYVRLFDGAHITPRQFRVRPEEYTMATKQVDASFRAAARQAARNIERFARAGMRKNWSLKTPGGGETGEFFSPIDRIGAYIPGGAAPLASTALMTLILARVAGVPERVACTPAGSSGGINPYLLYALQFAGATEIYKLGGIQAIGAMAYGTASLRKVRKIVGPGGPYVTAAKRLVYGEVDLDMVAGPSEIAILADDTAHPAHVAADLLSQAEHGTGFEKSLLVTPSLRMAQAVQKELARQAITLNRREAVTRVLTQGTLLVVVPDLDTGMDLINRFAPEHFELLTRDAHRRIRQARHCGAVFVGPWTPESAGDFVAGPSHVLPTGGTAAVFSGLTVDSFRRRTSVIRFTRKDLAAHRDAIETLGRVERLDAHARSAAIRFTNPLPPAGIHR